MANKPIDVFMIREIIRLKESGYSHKEISRVLSISRTTLIQYVKRISDSGMSAVELCKLSDEDLKIKLQPEPILPQQNEFLYERFAGYSKELRKKGVTLKRLWQEYKQEEPMGIQYSQFCFHYGRWRSWSDAYMPRHEKAGDKLYIDYAGSKLHIVDVSTGEIQAVDVFVGVLGCSDKIYVEASFSQRLEDFLYSLENCLHYYGGVPAAIVSDNLKSAVTTPSKYEPHINEQLARFASHYSTAILPARSKKPKDKPSAENAVIIAYRDIYAALRNKVFFSLEELNKAIRQELAKINSKRMQKWPYSRDELFEELDRPALRPLATERFELVKIKWLTVQKNCHVQIVDDKSYYSAPFSYVGKKVKVVYSRNSVEIYSDYRRIAFHHRSHRPYQYVTHDEHMPSSHRFVAEWNKEKFLEWGEQIGEQTCKMFNEIFAHKAHPEQAFKSCLGILSLGKKYGNQRIENACKRAIHFGSFNYIAIKNILDQNLDEQAVQTSLRLNIPVHENIRGNNYYQ